ncbi:unnamed protein product, partial [Fusarium langsethiae]
MRLTSTFTGIIGLFVAAMGFWCIPNFPHNTGTYQAFYPYSILHTAPYGIWNMECNPYG